jgi:hypothetical protein
MQYSIGPVFANLTSGQYINNVQILTIPGYQAHLFDLSIEGGHGQDSLGFERLLLDAYNFQYALICQILPRTSIFHGLSLKWGRSLPCCGHALLMTSEMDTEVIDITTQIKSRGQLGQSYRGQPLFRRKWRAFKLDEFGKTMPPLSSVAMHLITRWQGRGYSDGGDQQPYRPYKS